MISAFNIITSPDDTTESSLFIEISCYGITYWAINAGNGCFALSVYHFKKDESTLNTPGYLKDLLTDQPLLQRPFKKINIVYAFAEALLVPAKFMNADLTIDMLDMVYGDDCESDVKSDFVYQLNLHTIYRVPRQGEQLISQSLPAPVYGHHLYSLLAAMPNSSGNQLYCVFGSSYIIIKLVRKGSMQIIQQFSYKTPEDAAYYLLSSCSQFESALPETEVVLNGMIDEDSKLYEELKKYFPVLRFGSLPETFSYDEAIKEYPAHYFSHLFEIAACV